MLRVEDMREKIVNYLKLPDNLLNQHHFGLKFCTDNEKNMGFSYDTNISVLMGDPPKSDLNMHL